MEEAYFSLINAQKEQEEKEEQQTETMTVTSEAELQTANADLKANLLASSSAPDEEDDLDDKSFDSADLVNAEENIRQIIKAIKKKTKEDQSGKLTKRQTELLREIKDVALELVD